ncbi:MAG: hypothetical protein KGI29_03350 [Pseudomonadota bacterium]|nr:hypothetical protein [Pseudomonadota bacterium]
MWLFSAIMASCAIIAFGNTAIASPRRYTYQVYDHQYGMIGTYSNIIRKIGNAMTIDTEAHIRVSLLGFTLYSQEVHRMERWVGNRIVYFHGVTTESDKPVEVDGQAKGDHFIIVSPNGNVTAPGTIRPANPWSISAAGGDMIFMPDTGIITKAHTDKGEETSLMVDGALRQVRQYHINAGDEQYNVWLDDNGTPVKFTMQDKDSDVTFTLASSPQG